MGGGRGGGYSADAEAQVLQNLTSLNSQFGAPSAGKYGRPAPRGQARRITSSDPDATAKEFFRVASQGAQTRENPKPGLYKAKFADGTIVVYRTTSSSDGSPAVNFRPSKNIASRLKPHKIHFVQE